jgi:hypothetical protein
MFGLTLDSDWQAMGRFDDAILDCKAAIVNDPDVCIFNHLLQDLYLNSHSSQTE